MNDNYQCPFCNEWVCDFLHCCEGKHYSDWVEAEYAVMAWPTVDYVAVEPLIAK